MGAAQALIEGGLYTRDYLERGICEEPEWQALAEGAVEALRAELSAVFSMFPLAGKPVEGVTERDLIYPVLEALGWRDLLVQQQVSSRRRDDVPDALLFPDTAAKAAANAEREPYHRYRHGVALVEAKRWLRALDRADGEGAPSSQMLRYLRRADEASAGRLRWGILTNGRWWRLYWQGARSRAEEFLELDLSSLLDLPGSDPDLFSIGADREHWLKVFFLMFRRDSFVAAPGEAASFHAKALASTRKWEARIAEDLSRVVFEDIYPSLIEGIAASLRAKVRTLSPQHLVEIRQTALTLLYRLLFVLYAEDRGLLPVRHAGYAGYSLDRMREAIARQLDERAVLSDKLATHYGTLRNLFRAIDRGEPSLGLPGYNGGLFDPAQHELLEEVDLPDALMAKVIDALSRREAGDRRLRINYRDLSVQQLGSIYERMLEYAVVADESGLVQIRLSPFARKGSGSYYTPEELVHLILERTIGPLLDERQQVFDDALSEIARIRPAERVMHLAQLDPAAAFLSLRVCDPAMGSGHFLVSLVDMLADRILAAMADAEIRSRASLGDGAAYRSPLQERIESVRRRILERAAEEGWSVVERQLDDRHIVRRMILKRVVFGVDKNPMAVELAKVSLWLHTFTVGAPLSFLDHHLRCGDSLFGEFVRPIEDFLHERGSLILVQPVQQAKAAARGMALIEEMSDADIAEVEQSERTFAGVAEATRALGRYLDFFHGLRWIDKLPSPKARAARKRPKMKLAEAAAAAEPALDILDGTLGDPVDVIAKFAPDSAPRSGKERAARKLIGDALAVADRERFFHWQVAFPGVWDKWESAEPSGGFDAVIGNPPWDRIKLQEVEWFATRRPEIAMQQRASDRTRMIGALKKAGDPLHADYERAAESAASAARVARSSGYFPLLSGGDINIYSLFVERAQALIHSKGLVGLICPSGIAADKGASDFFGTIATTGRLAALFDFENRRTRFELEPYFPDVDSRFKFCAFVTGARERTFARADCAFFLQSYDEIANLDRCFPLTPEDFTRVNPNTKTAPVFRTRRDAEIVRRIYERLPVLNDHSKGAKGRTWPVHYLRMFDMTNDARLFRKRAELEKEGVYPVAGGRLRKGYLEFLPLYEGKMMQMFDHRAASIQINVANLNRPAQPSPASHTQKANPDWVPDPQYWVSANEVKLPDSTQYVLGFKEITAPTNARTMIAALLPPVAFGNKVPLLLFEKGRDRIHSSQFDSIWLVANLNSFAFDFVARQKIQGQTLNWFIVEQLPVVPWSGYASKLGGRTVADIVRKEVLHLTYVSNDMRPFAEDFGYKGPPFLWDEEDRRHRRARLDAIFFQLYGFGEEEASYALDTFPIVRAQDEQEFGRYRSRDLILGYMRAFAAGDLDTQIAA